MTVGRELRAVLVGIIFAVVPAAAQKDADYPWDPQYKTFDCAGTLAISIGSAERGPSELVLSAEAGPGAGKIRIAAAAATPLMSGEPGGEGFEDVSAGLRQVSPCAIALPATDNLGSGRVAIHVQADPDRPVVAIVGSRRWVTAPGSTTYNGKIVRLDAGFSALRTAALTYSSQFPETAELVRGGEGLYRITPAGLRAHMEGAPTPAPANPGAIESWRLAWLRLKVASDGRLSAEPLNGPARDPAVAAAVSALRMRPFQTENRPVAAEGALPLLLDGAGRVYSLPF
jgi:hypothetical protein